MTERFMIDDCGTLIDMHTRDTFDYVSDVCELLNRQHETIHRLNENIDELLSVNVEEDLLKENEELKSFIKSLASPDGKIWLSSGYGYKISKILKGDVE